MSDEKKFDFDLDTQEQKKFDVTYTAETAGFVIALVSSDGMGGGFGSCTIIGKAGRSESSQQLRAATSIFISDVASIPNSSFCMPVGRNESWIVTTGGGDPQGGVTVFWMPFRVDFS